ncbi:tetratricopeptide repeat protein [Candidatus Desantisbacteria bacterium]|nr:tetratricopeptide repeat protein [Candidatus Desantisbacteria bacterium]
MVNKDKLFKNASEYYQQGKWDKAVDIYKKILKTDPDNIQVFNMLGDVYVNKNDMDKAYEEYKKAADAFENQGLLNKAIAINKKILRIQPDSIDIYFKLADLYTQLGLIGEANEHYLKIADIYSQEKKIDKLLDIYKKIVDLNPKNIIIRQRLVKMYLNENMKEQAAKEYLEIADKYKEINQADNAISMLENAKNELPEYIEINRMLGSLYRDKNNPEKALTEIQKILLKNPLDKNAFIESGKMYKTLGKFDDLISLYENFLKNSTGENELKKELLSLYLEKNILNKTENILKEFLEQDKNNIDLHTQLLDILQKQNKEEEVFKEHEILAKLYLQNKELDKAKFFFEYILKKDPENLYYLQSYSEICELLKDKEKAVECYLHIAEIKDKIGEKDEAVKYYQKIVRINPDQIELLFKLVNIYKNQKKFNEAIENLKIIIDKKPDDLNALKKLGEIFFESNKYEEAREIYLKILTLSPDNKTHEILAEIYLHENKIDKATDELKNILESDPGNIEIRSRLSELKLLSFPQKPEKTQESESTAATYLKKEIKDLNIDTKKTVKADKEFEIPMETIMNYLREAKLRVSHKQIELAVELYIKILKLDFENEESHVMLKELVSDDRYLKIIDDIKNKKEEIFKQKAKGIIERPQFLEEDEEKETDALKIILKEFKSGITEYVEEEDFENHYNLGIAYKETGLLDEAIEEFKIAANKEENIVQCYGILGICYMEKGIYGYEEFYGLNESPFSNAPESKFYFETNQHAEAMKRLFFAIDTMKGLAVVLGDIGTGKTTLARKVLDRLQTEKYEAALLIIVHKAITAEWILRKIAQQLGVENPSNEKVHLLDQLFKQLLKIDEMGKKAVVLIDEANMLENKEIMEEFRGLLNLELPGKKLLSLILIGLPELDEHLKLDEPLRQRVAVKFTLRSLSLNIAAEYIKHRLKIAGIENPERIFNDEAIVAIYKYSNGIPRLINTICDNALFESFLIKKLSINKELIKTVSFDLGLNVGLKEDKNNEICGSDRRV